VLAFGSEDISHPNMPPIPGLRFKIVALLAIAIAVNYLDRQNFPIVISEVEKEIPLSNQQYSQLQSLFLFAYAISYAVGGRIIDGLGARLGYSLMIVIWSFAESAPRQAWKWRKLHRYHPEITFPPRRRQPYSSPPRLVLQAAWNCQRPYPGASPALERNPKFGHQTSQTNQLHRQRRCRCEPLTQEQSQKPRLAPRLKHNVTHSLLSYVYSPPMELVTRTTGKHE